MPPSVEQLEYNLLNRNNFKNNYIPLQKNKFTGSMIASPLAKCIIIDISYSNIVTEEKYKVDTIILGCFNKRTASR